jgi:hypothetical protein
MARLLFIYPGVPDTREAPETVIDSLQTTV